MEVQLINLNTNVSLTFDTQNFILNEIVHDNCVVQHNTSKTIKQIGEYVKSTNVNSRTVNITGTAIGQSELDLSNKKQSLLNLTSPFSSIKVILDNKFTLTGKCQSLVKWGIGHNNNNRYFVKFSIDILAPNTLWYALGPTTVSLSPYINEFKFPIAIPEEGFIYGHKDSDTLTNIFNNCNVPIPMQFTITSLATIINPKIIRVQDGKSLTINTTIQPNDILTIDTTFGSKSVTLNGENIISDFDFKTSSWLMLQPGLNTFTYGCKNEENKENLNINITYTQAYWGVF